ncbi:hypothetical protein [Nannocystis pusilla]|uniref:hypothetical protein n=1 Tax=Nannocystis pusilla TaxID=889268 RepID=UPI003B77B291
MTPEGIGWWIHRANESPKQARTAFEDANDCTLKPMDSLTAYLTMGARYAFVWYWQAGTATGRGYYDRLRRASVPLNTSTAKIEARLVDVGLLPEEAAGLYKWLGASVVLLLHRDGSRTTPNTTSSSEKPPANTTKNRLERTPPPRRRPARRQPRNPPPRRRPVRRQPRNPPPPRRRLARRQPRSPPPGRLARRPRDSCSTPEPSARAGDARRLRRRADALPEHPHHRDLRETGSRRCGRPRSGSRRRPSQMPR